MFVNAIFKQSQNARLTQQLARLNNCTIRMPSAKLFGSVPSTFDKSDDLSKQELVSLEKFYASVAQKNLTDDQALEYMHFAAKLAQLEFKDEAEMLTAKDEFVSALAFIDKLEEVDVKGVEPLGNVLEFYGGNEDLVRSEEDFALMAKEEEGGLEF